ncbi:hypothetical protein PHMEG_00017035 [Phytophthora megakarya]|uniref:BZIP domain-containing protein n=1 Tax=Phytophthora megakarya TaxID=4795 RepID=A0A225VZ23_9STRA|nr:hypothetical protein PHMEG_00017035 [Phytophthora megakarya]
MTEFVRLVNTSIDESFKNDFDNVTTAAEALIRHRRRNQQRKYRKQQRDYTKDLEYDVRRINEEIALLQQQLQYASMGISRSQTRWVAATEYFKLFRNGLRSPSGMVYSCVFSALESFMAPNVKDGLMCGPQAVLTRTTVQSIDVRASDRVDAVSLDVTNPAGQVPTLEHSGGGEVHCGKCHRMVVRYIVDSVTAKHASCTTRLPPTRAIASVVERPTTT